MSMGHARANGDRRVHHRVDLDGRAVVFQRGAHVGQYALENLSAGGAFISGERELRPGHLVHVLIDFAAGNPPMSMTGSIHRVREADNGVSLAIRFPVLSADQEDAIQDAVLRTLLRREEQAARLPLLVFEPRPRVRQEIEAEIRSFGLPVTSVESLDEAVRELEGEEVEYAGLVIHSATHDRASMEVVEFFARTESLQTIILPEPDGELNDMAKRLSTLPHVSVPRIWSRSELRRALRN
ncbi:MAG: PilZ domain-containing protein [Myxococcales bacterium]|nr:PilZ domain-containing protein [Myxococcales bacterium]